MKIRLRRKKEEDRKEEIEEETNKKEMPTFVRIVEEEKIEVPEETNRKIFKKRSWKHLWFKKVTIETMKQPILILIKENGDVSIIEKVKTGLFEMTSTFNKEENKAINLTANKLLNLKYGSENIKCWIAYESEAVPYPLKINQDSRDFYQIIKRVAMNYKDLSLGGMKGRGIIKIVLITIAVILVGITLAVSSGVVSTGGGTGLFIG